MMADKKYIELEPIISIFKQAEAELQYTACSMEQIYETLREAPAADVRPVVKGRWETADDPESMVQTFSCSNCGYDLDEFYVEYAYPGRTDYYYCPNCGADMRGAE